MNKRIIVIAISSILGINPSWAGPGDAPGGGGGGGGSSAPSGGGSSAPSGGGSSAPSGGGSSAPSGGGSSAPSGGGSTGGMSNGQSGGMSSGGGSTGGMSNGGGSTGGMSSGGGSKPAPGSAAMPTGSSGTQGGNSMNIPKAPTAPTAPTGGFDPSKVGFNANNMNSDNMRGLNTANTNSNTMSQMPPSSMGGMTQSQVRNIPPTAMQGISSQQMQNFSSSAVQGMSNQQVGNMQNSVMQGMSSKQLSNFQPSAVSGFATAQINNMPTGTINNMSSAAASKFFANMNSTTAGEANLTNMMPAGWSTQADGTMMAPTGTSLSLPNLSTTSSNSKVKLPPNMPNMNKGFGAGGQGNSANNSLNTNLGKAGLSNYSSTQNTDGILNIKPQGTSTGSNFAFMPNTNGISQGSGADSGVIQNKNGFFESTSSTGQKTTFTPAPKSTAGLFAALDAGDSGKTGTAAVTLGSAGDVTMTIPNTLGSSSKVSGIFSPVITTAPTGTKTGVSFVTSATGTTVGQVVYEDGTLQTFTPTTPNPDAFTEAGTKFPGVTAMALQSDGTFKITFQGKSYLMTPDFTLGNITPNDSGVEATPSISVTPEGKIKFTSEVDGNIVDATLSLTAS